MPDHDDLFDTGLTIRRQVLGADYVDDSLASADEFMMAFQRLTTEWCWGYAWGRIPAGLEAFKTAHGVLAEAGALGQQQESE